MDNIFYFFKLMLMVAIFASCFAIQMRETFGGNRAPEKKPVRMSNFGIGTAVKLIGTNEPRMIVERVVDDQVHVRWLQVYNTAQIYHRDIYPDAMLTRCDSPLAGASSVLKY